MPATNWLTRGKKGDIDFPPWWEVVAFILGLLAIALFFYIVLKTRQTGQGVFDMLCGYFGGLC